MTKKVHPFRLKIKSICIYITKIDNTVVSQKEDFSISTTNYNA